MTEWKKYKLKEVASFEISSVDKKIKDGQKLVRLCNFVDVYKNWTITKEHYANFMVASAKDSDISKLGLKKGQVAITKDSETRDDIGVATYIADDFEDVVLGYHCALITPNPNLLDGAYLNAFMHSKYIQRYFENNATGSGMRYTLSVRTIEDIPLLLPDLPTQKRIASVLSNIDRKIALNRAMNEELEQTARDLYDYWFLQFDFPDANGKPYRSSGGKMVYNPQLKREIPQGWEVKSVNDLLNKVKNTYKVPTKEYLKDGKYPIIDQATDTYFAGWSNTDDAVVTQHPIVVFGDHSCAVKYVDIDFCRGADGTQLICSNDVPTEYLYFAILNTRISSGYARHFSFLKNSPIIIPNSKYLKLYQTQTRPFFKTITSNRMENNNLLKLRDELLPLLMNGQVEVKD